MHMETSIQIAATPLGGSLLRHGKKLYHQDTKFTKGAPS
jgi:hypothetical protein